ncbi:MAG: DUF971 domain-containing protein [Proteobacteria bacterium]|nr:DUF971 domain-containing protein [Burkholderiales bacterium]
MSTAIGSDGDPPVSIVIHSARRELELTWADGTVGHYPAHWLRTRCRCAQCTAIARTGALTAGVSQTVSIIGCAPQGRYALQLTFDDGHDRGIYPFAYLREIDPARSRE